MFFSLVCKLYSSRALALKAAHASHICRYFVLQGISSLAELWATKPDYPCCTFRGNFIKVDLTNGDIVWRTYMTPDNNGQVGGFSGKSLWGSSPAIGVRRNRVYIGSGD
jgi:polyvinyl alcohol dehydrogenase (cytochrome)